MLLISRQLYKQYRTQQKPELSNMGTMDRNKTNQSEINYNMQKGRDKSRPYHGFGREYYKSQVGARFIAPNDINIALMIQTIPYPKESRIVQQRYNR